MDMSRNEALDFEDEMPYFLELTPEGKEISYKPKIYYIKPQETIIGKISLLQLSAGKTKNMLLKQLIFLITGV